MVPHTISIMSVCCFDWIRQQERERKEVTTVGGESERGGSTIPGSCSSSRPNMESNFFNAAWDRREERKRTQRATERQAAHVVRLEAREGDGSKADRRRRDPPIGQQTGRPPSYPKNLVGQCNTAPPQSLQLAVWALFGVVS